MLFRPLFACALVFPTFLIADTAMARTNWQGEAMVTGVSAACANDGWAVGNHALVTYLPANVDNNGTKSFMALHLNRRNAYSYGVTGNIVAGSGYSAVAISSAGNFFTFGGQFTQFSQSPVSLTTTTAFVTMRGQITNFSGYTGCTVNFDASFVRRR